jgi:Ca2+-binding RTX toxin-like protein
MTIFNVQTASGLTNALAQAHGGDTISLAAGDYGEVSIDNVNFSQMVTITSASGSQAVFDGLAVTGSSGLAFNHLTFSTVGTVNAGPDAYANPFSFANSQKININSVTVTGDPSLLPANQPNGLLIRYSSNIHVVGSKFQYVHVGLGEFFNNNIVVSHNIFHHIGNDGIDNAGSSYVEISDNTFRRFEHGDSTQHPDAIQFWTTGTTASATNIDVSNNLINLNKGTLAQGVFITDDVGTLPYQNVTVTNNMIIGALGNGIALNHINNGVVTGNDVLTLTNEVASYGPVTSRIVLLNDSGVTLQDNHALKFDIETSTGVVASGNTVTNAITPDFVFSQVIGQMSSMAASVSPFDISVPSTSHSMVVVGDSSVTVTANNLGDRIVGNNANDVFIGGAGNDILTGGSGNDIFQAGSGNDLLTGGGGTDTYQFAAQTGQDTITDFGQGPHNMIDISALLAAGNQPILSEYGNDATISFDHSAATITLLGVDYHSLIATSTGYTI